jgi:hypothetical protein
MAAPLNAFNPAYPGHRREWLTDPDTWPPIIKRVWIDERDAKRRAIAEVDDYSKRFADAARGMQYCDNQLRNLRQYFNQFPNVRHRLGDPPPPNCFPVEWDHNVRLLDRFENDKQDTQDQITGYEQRIARADRRFKEACTIIDRLESGDWHGLL